VSILLVDIGATLGDRSKSVVKDGAPAFAASAPQVGFANLGTWVCY
jgi:hypothetical protein